MEVCIPLELATLPRSLQAGINYYNNGRLLLTSASDLALLAATLHRLNVEHPRATVLFVGTGLPHVCTVLSSSGVTHPDRLSQLEPLPLTLSEEEARYALIEHARRIGVTWEPDAAQIVLDASQGYPAHLQFYAHQIWMAAVGPDRITLTDAQSGMLLAEATLTKRTLQPSFASKRRNSVIVTSSIIWRDFPLLWHLFPPDVTFARYGWPAR